jgi:hypothetical protein
MLKKLTGTMHAGSFWGDRQPLSNYWGACPTPVVLPSGKMRRGRGLRAFLAGQPIFVSEYVRDHGYENDRRTFVSGGVYSGRP